MLKPPSTSRDIMPDLLRAWALIGIALVNVEMFSSSLMTGYTHEQMTTGIDRIAVSLVVGLFAMKSYSLFSMMFGAGLGYQMASAVRTGDAFGGRYFRRMSGLLILGLLHFIFFFLGDILIIYSILGSIIYLCRNMSGRTLIRWGIVLIAFQTCLILFGGVLTLLMEQAANADPQAGAEGGMTADEEFGAALDAVFADGTFMNVAIKRLSILPILLPNAFFIQGIAAAGFIMMGLGFYKLDLISQPDKPFWKKARYIFLPIGLIITAAGAYIYMTADSHRDGQAIISFAVIMAGSGFSTMGYAGWLAKLSQIGTGPILRFIARGGSATLSAYLMQSVLLSAVFLEFGLGLFGELSASAAIGIALGIAVFTLCFVSLWLKFFQRGPMEIVLRRWTYLGRKSVNV